MFKLPFLPQLKMVAIVFSTIVAAFFTGRLIGWNDGKKQAYEKMRKAEEKRKDQIDRNNKEIDRKINRTSRDQLGKWLRLPRNRR